MLTNNKRCFTLITNSDLSCDKRNTNAECSTFQRNVSSPFVYADERINKYLMIADQFRSQLQSKIAVKDINQLYVLLKGVIEKDTPTQERMEHFFTVQLCTCKKQIRQVVQRLTLVETHKALILFCDVSFFPKTFFSSTQSQYRQTWILELFKRLCHEGQSCIEACFLQLKPLFHKAEEFVILYDSMGKFYGKLTTVLDHQFRLRLKNDMPIQPENSRIQSSLISHDPIQVTDTDAQDTHTIPSQDNESDELQTEATDSDNCTSYSNSS